MRLLMAAALHIDASVYLLDNTMNSFPQFALRCMEKVEQRQREGAAVVHGARRMIEEVSRLCGEVIWFEEDGTVIRGRPVDVALAVEKRTRKELHPLSAPILAALPEPDRPVEVPGTVEIELHVLRKDMDFAFTLELADSAGHLIDIEQPTRFTPEGLGLYHLHVDIPPGLLPEAAYKAKLTAEVGAIGSERRQSQELLSFDLAAGGNGSGSETDATAGFELIAKDRPPQLAEAEIEAGVGRSLA
jgi:hypothetical protein